MRSTPEANEVIVRHGRLLDVVGRACRAGDLTFCPALVEIKSPLVCHRLSRFHRPAMLAFGDFDVLEEEDLPDALWVRGRLPGLFGYRPLQVAEGRPYLLNAGFVAVSREDDALVARPFAVSDHVCGDAHLILSRKEPAAARKRVAHDFWGLLVSRGVDEDFRAEGLEWSTAFDPGGLDPVDVMWEAGRWRGVYYAESLAHDDRYDPDSSRPDRSLHRYRRRPSRPVRRTRRDRRVTHLFRRCDR